MAKFLDFLRELSRRSTKAIGSGIYHTAEGIGGAFDRGMALPGKLAGGMDGLRGRLGTAASAARGFSVRPLLSNVSQRLNQAGFVGGPREYFQNLGAAGKLGVSAIRERLQARRFGELDRDERGRFLPRQHGLFASTLGRAGNIGRRLLGTLDSRGAASAATPTSSGSAIAGKVAAGFAKLASPMTGIPKAAALIQQLVGPTLITGLILLLKRLTFGLSESNRDLAKWNGALAASFASLDIQRMRMDIRTANATSGTGAELNRQLGEVMTEFQPIREDLGRLVNLVGITAAKGLKAWIGMQKAIVENAPFLKELRDGLLEIEKEMKKGRNEQFPGNQALEAAVQLPGQPARRLDDVARAQGAFLRRHRDGAGAGRGRRGRH